jgi:hypothetical protein
VVLAGAALNELRAMACVCVRTGTAGLSLVSVVTTVLASDHRAAVLYRSDATCVTGSKDGLCSGKVACMPHNNAERYNNNNAEFWNWVSPRHEKARAAGRMSSIGLA